jgi:hypothetical protein
VQQHRGQTADLTVDIRTHEPHPIGRSDIVQLDIM